MSRDNEVINKTKKDGKLIRAPSPIPTVANTKNAVRSSTVYAHAFKSKLLIFFISTIPLHSFTIYDTTKCGNFQVEIVNLEKLN